MQRFQGTAFWIALIVFMAVYVLIAFEILHRTLAAFLGAAVLLLITHTFGHFDEAFNILTYEQALHAVDWNVIFLLMGMMIIVGVLKVSGVFQWLAYKSFQVARGHIFVLSSALCVVTAVTSAFLDNVTTMLLLTPVTMEIAVVLGRLSVRVSRSGDSGLELRRHRHAHRRPAQHHDRIVRGDHLQRIRH